MSEKTKETPITIDDKEYILEDMTEQCRTLVSHTADLDRKIASSQFNLEQLQFGRQAFIAELKTQLEM
jgi:cell division protein ZapA (FtsZ GTPase activity inhibitor)